MANEIVPWEPKPDDVHAAHSPAREIGTFPADSIKARRPSDLHPKAGYKTANATSMSRTLKPNLANGEVFI